MNKNKIFILAIFAIVVGFVYSAMLTSCSDDSYLSEYKLDKDVSLVDSTGMSYSTRSSPYASKLIYTVPRFYEYDPSDNPNHYNWCAHAALKSVLKYHGISISMTTLHNYFYANTSSYRNGGRCGDGRFCANLYDMYLACQKTNQINLPNSSYESINSISNFWQRLKDGVDYNKPAIVPSTYQCSYGHMYVVVGYQEGANYNQKYLYLRDVLFENNVSGTFGIYDRMCTAQEFYNKFSGNQIFFVRP